MAYSISLKRFSWCGDRYSIMLKVSNTHPRRTYQVYQVHSPTYSFFRYKISFWFDMYLEYRVQNTFSGAWNKVRRMWCRLCTGLLSRPQNSSTKTSV